MHIERSVEKVTRRRRIETKTERERERQRDVGLSRNSKCGEGGRDAAGQRKKRWSGSVWLLLFKQKGAVQHKMIFQSIVPRVNEKGRNCTHVSSKGVPATAEQYRIVFAIALARGGKAAPQYSNHGCSRELRRFPC